MGSWTWNIKTNQLDWSDQMYHIFGIERETFTGSLETVIAQAIHPADRATVEQAKLAVINEGNLTPLEYRVVWNDVTYWPNLSSMARIAGNEENGKIRKVLP
jgi:PAS domain-containing protein